MKTVPIKEEKEYLRLDKQIKELQATQSELKVRFASYHKRGYIFALLTPVESEKFSPPWKQLCLELLAKFMEPKQRKAWMRNLLKRFPRQPVAPSFRARKVGKEEEIAA